MTVGFLRDLWRHHFGWFFAFTLLVGVASAYLLSQVNQTITERDRQAIRTLAVDSACEETPTFESELACVRAIQEALLHHVPDRSCESAWFGEGHEPMDLLERGYGCCYDRSRFIEKALAHYGFQTRHAALHQLDWGFPLGYLDPDLSSHALSEVMTARGWMAVDSQYRFVGLDEDGEVLTAPELKPFVVGDPPDDRRLVESLPDSLMMDYRVTYGLYSRHGFFFGPPVPLPDIDWHQFAYNFHW